MAIDIENRRQPICTASSFGRIFFGIGSRVYFSQVYLNSEESLGRMYQSNDPTSADNPDLLPTDGGEIQIPQAEDIQFLEPFYNGILAFARNGVWHILGGDQGFSALGYSVRKINSFGIIPGQSVVRYQSTVMYLASEGVITCEVNENANVFSQNLTESTINSFYEEFIDQEYEPSTDPLDVNHRFSAAVDPVKKVILWVKREFNATECDGLMFDMRAGAWYPQRYSVPAERVIYTRDHGLVLQCKDYLTTISNPVLKDVVGGSTYDYEYYIQTQPETLKMFSHKKSAPNMLILFNKTETEITDYDFNEQAYQYDKPSACTLTVTFDFDGSGAGNRVTKPKDIYRPLPRNYMPASIPTSFDTGDTVISFRDIIRGQGKAVQFRFDGTPGKDMQILGYSVEYSTRGRQ